jgi:uncharacterized membrane protein
MVKVYDVLVNKYLIQVLTGGALVMHVFTPAAAAQTQTAGEQAFARECRVCHDGSAATRAPSPDVLRQRSPASGRPPESRGTPGGG